MLSVLAVAPGWHLGDLYTLALAGVGAAVLIGVVATTGRRSLPVASSVVVVVVGALGAVALELLDVRPLDPEGDHLLLERLTEVALIVAVFSAGLTIERHVRRRSWVSIAVLLGVVMPLTILAVAAFGVWAMGLSFPVALLLGAVLAPTDPVLAGEVGLTPPGGEVLGEPRLSLHTEAGFNDGLASPFVVLGLFAVGQGGTAWAGEWLVADLLYGAGFALALGAAAGLGGAWLLTRAEQRGIVAEPLSGVAAVGAVAALYGLTEALGAYGLLAVFASGFAFRRYEFDHHIHGPVHHAIEATGKTLEFVVLLMFGTMLTTTGLGVPGLGGWGLALVLLFVIRPVLVMATAGRSFLGRREQLFLGFFGVRGVAALFYAAVVVEADVLSAEDQHLLVWTTIACVLTSIFVHGISAAPLSRRWLAPGVRT